MSFASASRNSAEDCRTSANSLLSSPRHEATFSSGRACDHAIQRQLRRLEPSVEVLAIGDPNAPPAGILDSDILLWMEATGYILITENRSTIPVHLGDHYTAGHHFPGVFWIRPHTPLGRIVEELYLIWYTSTADEYTDRVLFIPL